MTDSLSIAGVPVADTFAEAFDMKATRVIITAEDETWCDQAAAAMVGFGTSVIACGIEIAVEQRIAPESSPDGRPGVAILAFAVSGRELEKQIPRRAGQCVLTCPTTALFAGLHHAGVTASRAVLPKRIPLGKSLRYFGDGHQIAKKITLVDDDGRDRPVRYWRIPVMDGEFVCEHDVGRTDAIGGGNFILLGRDVAAATTACRAAIAAIQDVPGVITPFPGGATRSGSKVGSKYATLFASTNEAFSPELRHIGESMLPASAAVAIEIVIDGLTFNAVAEAMRVGITAACRTHHGGGLVGVTAGNYGGKLGRHHFRLRSLVEASPS